SREVTDSRRLEQQVHQLQRMEAIGRLAGGIAHDFNNLLSVILGYADLMLMTGPNSDYSERLELMRTAGMRAAELTKQLLAFGRRQVMQAKVVDLNHIIKDTRRMLGRLIGENIEVAAELDPALRRLKADPSQLEQVLTNLILNARDAM